MTEVQKWRSTLSRKGLKSEVRQEKDGGNGGKIWKRKVRTTTIKPYNDQKCSCFEAIGI